MVAAAASLAVLAGCGSDPERRASTRPDDSVVLGTDPVPTPTETARKPARPKPEAEAEPAGQAPSGSPAGDRRRASRAA